MVYTGAIFTSAFLLFLVQPMIAKAILPSFGGAPTVWITAMLFFQAALLLGYLFVHLVSSRLDGRTYRLVHVGVLVLAALTLPVGLRLTAPADQGHPTAWVLLMLLVSVGAPFFALSTSGPALQRFFSLTAHSRAGNPYFLYVASNAGSLVALLAYPLVVERLLPLDVQQTLWSVAFVGLILLSGLCVLYVRRDVGSASELRVEGRAWSERAQWAGLAFVPSALMLGVTTYISSEFAALPLFWVLPLAAYLVTFMIAFSSWQSVATRVATRATPFVVLLALPALVPGVLPVWTVIPIHLLVLVVAGTAIHGRLAALAPRPEHLADFYVFLSLGGVLGGVFAALIAPHVFVVAIEYPLALCLAYLVTRRATPGATQSRPARLAAVLAVTMAAGLLVVTLVTEVSSGDRDIAGVLSPCFRRSRSWARCSSRRADARRCPSSS